MKHKKVKARLDARRKQHDESRKDEKGRKRPGSQSGRK